MTRTINDLEDEMNKVYSLVGELSEQLAQNRQLVTQLKARSTNVQGQVTHVGAGFPLRRFNLDISEEEFSSELEAFASHLVLENQQLQYENKQLNVLLKEYEQTMETVMSKFRGVAHASQQHDLSLHSYYTSLLQQLQTAHSSAQLHDDTSLSVLLHRLSTLLRSALRALGGEDTDIDLAAHLPGLMLLPQGNVNGYGSSNGNGSSPSFMNGLGLGMEAGPSSGSGPSGLAAFDRNGGGPSSPPLSPTSSNPQHTARRIARRPNHPSVPADGSQGGYIGTNGQGDWAMEREMEIMRLEDENTALREMLKIAQEANDNLGMLADEELEEKPVELNEPSPSIGTGRRRSSLTAEELAAGAEKEEEARRVGALFASPNSSGSGLGPVSEIEQDEALESEIHLAPGGNTGLGLSRRRSVEARPSLSDTDGSQGETAISDEPSSPLTTRSALPIIPFESESTSSASATDGSTGLQETASESKSSPRSAQETSVPDNNSGTAEASTSPRAVEMGLKPGSEALTGSDEAEMADLGVPLSTDSAAQLSMQLEDEPKDEAT